MDLRNHLRSLLGEDSHLDDSLTLTLGGKLLKDPSARLCDCDIRPYSLLSYDSAYLNGGMSNRVQDE